MLKKLFLILILSAISSASLAESIFVKYRGNLDLTHFQCELTEGSTVRRLCYDSKEEYAVVKLKNTYYHYCEIPAQIISNWRQATSLDTYYYSNVKGNYDCRVLRVPTYQK